MAVRCVVPWILLVAPVAGPGWRSSSCALRGLLPFLLATTVAAGCSQAASTPSACDGLSERAIGITRAEYGDCAGEILEALDEIEISLGRFVRTGDEEAKVEADSHSERLRHLMREVGFTADTRLEAREGVDRTIQRWPDGAMYQFNNEVRGAVAYYIATLRHPSEDNLREAQRRHALARQLYARFR